MSTTHTATSPNGRVSRQDIETKLREIRSDVDTAEEAAKGVGTLMAGAVVVVVVIAVYFFGRKRGKRASTVVEVRRF